MQNAIDVSNVTFRYAHSGPTNASPFGPESEPVEDVSAPVLDKVSFSVSPGEAVLICGGSGSGKSTALRLINRLVPVFHSGLLEGEIRIEGEDISGFDLSEAGRTSSTVFQNPKTQFFTTDVTSELAFRGENYGQDPQLILSEVAAAAASVGIEGLLGRKLDALSGGELQKVACAQAVAANTNILLFDEPTSNLSPEAIEEFTVLLQALRQSGHTIIVAEHRLYFMNGIADHVLMMEEGAITRRWSGQQFFSLPPSQARGLGLRDLTRPAAIGASTAQSDKTGAEGGQEQKTYRSKSGAEVGGVNDNAQQTDARHSGIVLEKLRFKYGSRPVLDVDHLHIPAGRIVGLVGPNGAGKSTFARVLSGLARPRRGSKILVDGRPTSARQRLGQSALVMQDVHQQLFTGSVAEEVTLGLNAAQKSALDLEQLLYDFDLLDLADRHPLSLSGGQKQRLVLASALARDAFINIFDEPTSGVDRRHLDAIAEHLRILADKGRVVLVITHDPELIDACQADLLRLDPLRLDLSRSGQSPQAIPTWEPPSNPIPARV